MFAFLPLSYQDWENDQRVSHDAAEKVHVPLAPVAVFLDHCVSDQEKGGIHGHRPHIETAAHQRAGALPGGCTGLPPAQVAGGFAGHDAIRQTGAANQLPKVGQGLGEMHRVRVPRSGRD